MCCIFTMNFFFFNQYSDCPHLWGMSLNIFHYSWKVAKSKSKSQKLPKLSPELNVFSAHTNSPLPNGLSTAWTVKETECVLVAQMCPLVALLSCPIYKSIIWPQFLILAFEALSKHNSVVPFLLTSHLSPHSSQPCTFLMD